MSLKTLGLRVALVAGLSIFGVSHFPALAQCEEVVYDDFVMGESGTCECVVNPDTCGQVGCFLNCTPGFDFGDDCGVGDQCTLDN